MSVLEFAYNELHLPTIQLCHDGSLTWSIDGVVLKHQYGMTKKFIRDDEMVNIAFGTKYTKPRYEIAEGHFIKVDQCPVDLIEILGE